MTREDHLDDRNTTVAQMRECVAQFVDERDWQRFHSPKNLSMAMAIEVSELMEHFQWIASDESRQLVFEAEHREAIADELADVCCYVLAMANAMQLDLATAVRDKMYKNRSKYPA